MKIELMSYGTRCRVLAQEGKFLSITFAQPHFRGPFFADKAYTWNVHHSTFGETFHYFVYVLCKGHRQDSGESSLVYDPSSHALGQGSTHEHMDQEDYLMGINLE